MVCAKCQKSQKRTELATPGVKRKNDLYFGSPASNDKSKTSTTSGASGIGKVGCAASANSSAKVPKIHTHLTVPHVQYARRKYSQKLKEREEKVSKLNKRQVEQGHKFCNRCAYKSGNACAICGKTQNKSTPSSGGPVVQGQKFSSK